MPGRHVMSREERWLELEDKLSAAQAQANLVVALRGPKSGPGPAVHLSDALSASELALPGYSTLDSALVGELKSKAATIEAYKQDRTRPRPCVFVLSAAAGAGKSRLVKCLADDLGLRLVTANLGSMRSLEDLGYWIEQVRNCKAKDEMPLLFLDEADSKPAEVATLLPLLWDGVFYWMGRELSVGKCVMILAMSDPRLRAIVEREEEEALDGSASLEVPFPKVDDLLSRISGGVIEISPIDARPLDKLCISLALLKRRYEDGIGAIQMPYLKLIVDTPFLHGARSIEALINHFPLPAPGGELRYVQAFDDEVARLFGRTTFRSNVFSFHVDDEGRKDAMQTWTAFRYCEIMVHF